MHNEPNSRLPGEGQPAVQAPEALNAAALARRRALIKGLGKGGAALAVVAPIQSYAVPKLNTGQVCSLSGLQSGVASHNPATTATCAGWPPTYFHAKGGQAANWPSGIDPASATFSSVFGGSDNRLLLKVFLDGATDANPNGTPSQADVDKSYWIAAYFNAQIASNNWVYTKEQVVEQYNLPGTQPEAYLNFYKTYLSQRV